MRRNRRIAYIVLAMLTGALDCLAQGLSLQDCMKMAQENKLEVKNAALDIVAAEAQRQEAFTKYFPQVTANALGFYAINPLINIGITDVLGKNDFAYNLQNSVEAYAMEQGFKTRYKALQKGWSTGVTALQPVFAGGRIVNGNQLAGLGVEAARLKEGIAVRASADEIESDWWQVIGLEEKMQTLEAVEALLMQLKRDVSAAVDAGLATRHDLLMVDSKVSELNAGKVKLRGGIRLSRMNLFDKIGYGYSLLEIDSVRLDHSCVNAGMEGPDAMFVDETQVASALEENRLLELGVNAAELQRKMALGEALPTVSIGASYTYNNILNGGDGGKNNGLVFAMVSVPLTAWWETSSKVRRMDAGVQKARNEEEFYRQRLILMVRQQWLQVCTSWESVQAAAVNREVAREAFEMASDDYSAGLSNLSSLLQAESALSQAMEEEAAALIDYQKACGSYRRLAGLNL